MNTSKNQDSGYVIVTVSGAVLHKPDPANPEFATKCGERGALWAWTGRTPAKAICTNGC